MSIFDEVVNRRNTNSYKWNVGDNELPMWVADMDFKTAPVVIDAIKRRVEIGAFGYSCVGEEYFKAYKDFWKRRHNVNIDIDEMIFSTGVVPALSSIVRKLTTVAENVVIMAPVYNIFYNSIYNNGRNILSSDLLYDGNNYSIDFVDLEEKLSRSQTTMMILCNPHNPIGKLWDYETLTKIGELCLKHNVVLVSDEIHCDIVKPGLNYVSVLSLNKDIRNNSVVLLAASKCFNLAGLQSATVVVPNKVLRHKVNRGLNTDEVAENNFFCTDAIVAALNDGEEWLNELNLYLDENKKVFSDYVIKNVPSLKVIEGEATYLVWVDTSKLEKDAKKFTDFLREKTGLFVTAGEEYGKCGRSFFRINLATQRVNIMDALERLKRGVELYIDKK